jgi:hypothetical protein
MSRGPASNQSSFILAMGNTPFIRVISFLLENRIFDYSKTDIAKNAEVGTPCMVYGKGLKSLT